MSTDFNERLPRPLNRPARVQTPPAELLPAPLRQPLAEYDALGERWSDADGTASGVEEQLHVADQADRQAYAAALRKGEDVTELGTPNRDQAEREIRAAEHTVSALHAMVNEASVKLLAQLVAHREQALADADRAADKAAADYTAALEQIANARLTYQQATALRTWWEHVDANTYPPQYAALGFAGFRRADAGLRVDVEGTARAMMFDVGDTLPPRSRRGEQQRNADAAPQGGTPQGA